MNPAPITTLPTIASTLDRVEQKLDELQAQVNRLAAVADEINETLRNFRCGLDTRRD